MLPQLQTQCFCQWPVKIKNFVDVCMTVCNIVCLVVSCIKSQENLASKVFFHAQLN